MLSENKWQNNFKVCVYNLGKHCTRKNVLDALDSAEHWIYVYTVHKESGKLYSLNKIMSIKDYRKYRVNVYCVVKCAQRSRNVRHSVRPWPRVDRIFDRMFSCVRAWKILRSRPCPSFISLGKSIECSNITRTSTHFNRNGYNILD